MVISIRRALLTHGGWPFWETVRKETSVKNKRDRLFFTQLFVPQASQSSYDRRAELDVRLAIPSAQSACGMEIFTKNGMAVSAMPFSVVKGTTCGKAMYKRCKML